MEIIAIILFLSILVLILYGYPVAFTLGGLSMLYAISFLDPSSLNALPPRIMGVMSNYVLLAVPLFVYMGIMLERSGLAENLLESMSMLFGRLRGGLAISVVIVGALLAASTGIVGATVITMGLISLPIMLKKGYHPSLATGTIASSGTLGQIIPPSVVLVLLGSVLNVSVGDLFKAAILPGFILVAAYIVFILIYAQLNPDQAPPLTEEEIFEYKKDGFLKKITHAFLFPFSLNHRSTRFNFGGHSFTDRSCGSWCSRRYNFDLGSRQIKYKDIEGSHERDNPPYKYGLYDTLGCYNFYVCFSRNGRGHFFSSIN